MEMTEIFAKKCDCCGKGMNVGYVDNGATYCSDRCLVWGKSPDDTLDTDRFIGYDISQWALDHENFSDDCYYTEWEEVEEDEYYLADGTLVIPNELRLTIAFGSDLVNAIENFDEQSLDDGESGNGGVIVRKDFRSKAERDAYVQGVVDMNGWNNYLIVSNEKAKELGKLI